ncbi:lipoprotein signal peptidase [Acidocella aquatica]|uniref:Lipoprotein signal peptidase n=1 Tax=Acidocella aquatica TaxID=1922313 RepID=A0ABQ5ZZU4_9PROT|nr:signal peptidase II [Acidocella aquatica]GLR65724.1 lipoprotein signal peptidase [Acidocella aquatica]
MNKRIAGLFLAALVLTADQGSKYWVLHGAHLTDGHVLVLLPVLNFVLVWNHGITFGMFAGAGAKVLLATVASVVILSLLVWLWRSKNWLTSLAAGAIAGGAVGNVADRLHYGAVVDFIQAHIGGWSWYVFNVGDAAIVCGVAALMLESLFQRPPVAPNGAQR